MADAALRALRQVKPGRSGRIDGDQGDWRSHGYSSSMYSAANILASGHPAMKIKHPYGLHARLSPDLTRVLAYWRGLLRGSATMPFWDDAKLSDLPDLAGQLFLVDVFQQPERFRFGAVGAALEADGMSGLFLDETKLERPFEFLRSQCAAAVETAEPTFFHAEGAERPYSRLVLPMWGDGRISMLLGAVDAG